MIYNLYSVRDDLTGFLSVTMDQNDDSAIRGFKAAVKNPDTLFFSNPEDYRLFRTGSFNTETGVITAETSPVLVCSAVSLKEVSDGE